MLVLALCAAAFLLLLFTGAPRGRPARPEGLLASGGSLPSGITEGWDVLRDVMHKSADDIHYSRPTDDPKVCMMVRTYTKQLAALPTFLLSAAASGLGVDNFRVFLVVTDPDYDSVSEKVSAIATTISFLVGSEDFATVLPVPFVQAAEPDYGYAQTDAALREHFYNASSQARGQPQTCDYLIVTNGDNYYARGFGHDLVKMTTPDSSNKNNRQDLVMFDWVTHYAHEPSAIDEPEMWTDGSGRPLQAQPRVSYIDLGACMWRLRFLKDNQLYYANAQGKWTNEADGYMVVKATRVSDCSWKILRKTLLVHQ